VRLVHRDDKGRITNQLMSTIFTNHAGAYVGECKMPK